MAKFGRSEYIFSCVAHREIKLYIVMIANLNFYGIVLIEEIVGGFYAI